MPIIQKTQSKKKNKVQIPNDPNPSISFGTSMLGFKRTDVNIYIKNLKKKLISLEKEYDAMQSGNKGGSGSFFNSEEREQIINQYERQLSDINEKINNEKGTSSMLEKECMRLQAEVEGLNLRLAKKVIETGTSDVTEIINTKAIINSALLKRLNQVLIDLNNIRDEFAVDEQALILTQNNESIETAGKNLIIDNINGSSVLNEFEKTKISGADVNRHNSGGQENGEITDAFDIDDEASVDDDINTPQKSVSVEIQPVLRMNEDYETNINNGLINADKVEDDSEFADLLFKNSSDFKLRGDDLIAKNPAILEKGDDITAVNPAVIEKGDDLDADLYELYINEGNDENDLFTNDDFFSNIEDDENSRDFNRLGFNGVNFIESEAFNGGNEKNYEINPNSYINSRFDSGSDENGMSSKIDISHLFL